MYVFVLVFALLCFSYALAVRYSRVALYFSFFQCTSYKLNTLHCSFNLLRVCVCVGEWCVCEGRCDCVCGCVDFAVVCLNFANIFFFFCFYLFLFLERLFKVAFLIYFIFGFHLRFLLFCFFSIFFFMCVCFFFCLYFTLNSLSLNTINVSICSRFSSINVMYLIRNLFQVFFSDKCIWNLFTFCINSPLNLFQNPLLVCVNYTFIICFAHLIQSIDN